MLYGFAMSGLAHDKWVEEHVEAKLKSPPDGAVPEGREEIVEAKLQAPVGLSPAVGGLGLEEHVDAKLGSRSGVPESKGWMVQGDDIRALRVVISSMAWAAEYQGNRLGEYVEEGIHNNRPYYKQRDNIGKTDTFLYYNEACEDEKRWMVGEDLGVCRTPYLRNPADTATPPESGWQYFLGGEEWGSDDSSLGLKQCGLEPCGRVEVTGRGKIANIMQHEMGSYFPAGNWLDGRPVYKKTEGETRYLRMEEGRSGWRVSPTLVGTGGYLESGRATVSPGSPAAGPSVRLGREGWRYWGGAEWQHSEGELAITCRVEQ